MIDEQIEYKEEAFFIDGWVFINHTYLHETYAFEMIYRFIINLLPRTCDGFISFA